MKWFKWLKLKHAIGQLSIAARGHYDNGVPRGDQVYVTLWNKAQDLIMGFEDEFEEDSDLVYAKLPALKQMGELAMPAHGKSMSIGKAIGILFVSLVLAPLTIGWFLGLVVWAMHILGGR